MCGRFASISPLDEVMEALEAREVSDDLRHESIFRSYNIAPGQKVLAVVGNGVRRLGTLQWGLVPSWAKDPSIGHKMINARCETLAEKPSFRDAFKKRRCLVVADGFYEWKKFGSEKHPMYFRLKSRKPFAFAGLYEIWTPPNGEGRLSTCTIITTPPNALMKPIHDRMPAILQKDYYAIWLDRKVSDTAVLKSLLVPFPDTELEAYEVSTLVNSPANNSERCIIPVE